MGREQYLEQLCGKCLSAHGFVWPHKPTTWVEATCDVCGRTTQCVEPAALAELSEAWTENNE